MKCTVVFCNFLKRFSLAQFQIRPFRGLYLSQDLTDIRSFRVSAKLSMAASPADTGFQLQYKTTEVFLFHLGKNYDSEVYSGLTNFFF